MLLGGELGNKLSSSISILTVCSDLASATSSMVRSGPLRRRNTDDILYEFWIWLMSIMMWFWSSVKTTCNLFRTWLLTVWRSCFPTVLTSTCRAGRPGVWMDGPMLQRCRMYITPARRVYQRRVLGARRRGKFSRLRHASYISLISSARLIGGGGDGARATSRKQQESSQIAWLASCVEVLRKELGKLKAQHKKTTPKPRKRFAKQRGASSNSLFDQLFSAMQDIKDKGQAVSDDQVLQNLRCFLQQSEGNAPNQQKDGQAHPKQQASQTKQTEAKLLTPKTPINPRGPTF